MAPASQARKRHWAPDDKWTRIWSDFGRRHCGLTTILTLGPGPMFTFTSTRPRHSQRGLSGLVVVSTNIHVELIMIVDVVVWLGLHVTVTSEVP